MPIPVLSSIRVLDPPSRRFLAFSALNVFAWQSVVGPAMVLCARSIDMPASWVGILMSFLPFSMLLVLFNVQLVTHFGSKRVMFSAWLGRNILMSFIFLLPLALRYEDPRVAWILMMSATLGFCFMRTLGVGGWFPWLHEIVPKVHRASFFGAEASVVHSINIFIMVIQALLLMGNPGLGRFLIIYAIGISVGFISLITILRIPGGSGSGVSASFRESMASYKKPLRNRQFLRFLILATGCFTGFGLYSSAHVLFMRDMLELPDTITMLIMALSSCAILLTIRAWTHFSDFSGSGLTMFKSLFGFSMIAFCFLSLLPGRSWTIPLLVFLSVAGAVLAGAHGIAIHRAMLGYVEESHRVGYSNLWIVATATAMGISPIIAGQCIDRWEMLGFRICFVSAGILCLICALLSLKVIQDQPEGSERENRLINTGLPLRTLARIMWITFGMHESNKKKAPQSGDAV